MAPSNYSFSGWATRNDLKCSDGRIIRKDAFRDQDGQTVPLVWMHNHNSPYEVLGHALLENRREGVYAYCTLNENEAAREVDGLVKNGDVDALSIYAIKLQQNGNNVLHGQIREVSVVLAGANPGAKIDNVILHSDGTEEFVEDAAVICMGDSDISVYKAAEEVDKSVEHSEEADKSVEHADEEKGEEKVAEEKEKTIQDVIDSMSEEQKKVLNYLVGKALEEGDSDSEADKEDEGEDMKHNVFDTNENEQDVLSHADMLALSNSVISDAKRYGSMRDSFLAHAEEYGIEDIDWLFPEAKNLNTPPEFIKRKDDWVSVVMNGVKHTPFSRIKSMFADLREDEARARGYIKGTLKKEEVFSLLKRITEPCTVYKKQKMDRDDVIDITDFDVIAWLKGEMRMMLDEEIARAIVFGDGRLASSDDKIPEDHIRPIISDSDLFTIKVDLTESQDEEFAKTFIDESIRSRKNYRGSGTPTLFAGEDIITEMLLLEDGIGHKLYKSEQELATTLRVDKIVHVPDEVIPDGIIGVFVNLNDYNVGADKGGAINMFDDFDIDYNQMKYLIETRCSGALVKPYSAIVMKRAS